MLVSQSNSPPVNQFLTNNVAANAGTVGLHPGIPTGEIGDTFAPPQGSYQNFLLRIPPNDRQLMANPNLANPSNQALYQLTNPNPSRINPGINRIISNPNQQAFITPGNYVPLSGNENLGSQSISYLVNRNQGTNLNQGYGNPNPRGSYYINQPINYGNHWTKSTNQAGHLGNARPSSFNQGTNYESNQNGNANQVGNIASQGSNVHNQLPVTGIQEPNQGPNPGIQGHNYSPNQLPASVTHVPSSLSRNPQASGTGNPGSLGKPIAPDSTLPSGLTSGSAKPQPANQVENLNQANNPFAPGGQLSTATENSHSNQPGSTNPSGSTNPDQLTSPNGLTNPGRSDNSQTDNQVNNPFAPGGSLSPNSGGSGNPNRSANPGESSNSQLNNQVDNSKQSNNPFAPGGKLSTSKVDPSPNQGGFTNPAGSANRQPHVSSQASNPFAPGGNLSSLNTNPPISESESNNSSGLSKAQPGDPNSFAPGKKLEKADINVLSQNDQANPSNIQNNPLRHEMLSESNQSSDSNPQRQKSKLLNRLKKYPNKEIVTEKLVRKIPNSLKQDNSKLTGKFDGLLSTKYQSKQTKPVLENRRDKTSQLKLAAENMRNRETSLKKSFQKLKQFPTKKTPASFNDKEKNSLLVKMLKSRRIFPAKKFSKKRLWQRKPAKRKNTELTRQAKPYNESSLSKQNSSFSER